MKNKKLFKTLTISASSLAVAAAAITAPILVTSTINNRQAKKKDGKNAGEHLVDLDGQTITGTMTLINGHPDYMMSEQVICKYVKLVDSTGTAITDEVTTEISGVSSEGGKLCCEATIAPGIYKIYAAGIVSLAEGSTYATVTFSQNKSQICALNIAFDETIVETSYILSGIQDASFYKSSTCVLPIIETTSKTGTSTFKGWNRIKLFVREHFDGENAKDPVEKIFTCSNGNITLDTIPTDCTSIDIELMADGLRSNSLNSKTGCSVQQNIYFIDGKNDEAVDIAKGQTKVLHVTDALFNPVNLSQSDVEITASGGGEVTGLTATVGEGIITLVASSELTTEQFILNIGSDAKTSAFERYKSNIYVLDQKTILDKSSYAAKAGESFNVVVTKTNSEGATVPATGLSIDSGTITVSDFGISSVEESKTTPGTYTITMFPKLFDTNMYVTFKAEETSSATINITQKAAENYPVVPTTSTPCGKIGTSLTIEFAPQDGSTILPSEKTWSATLDTVASSVCTIQSTTLSNNKVKVVITSPTDPTAIPGGGHVTVKYDGDEQGGSDFYFAETITTVTATTPNDNIKNGFQTLTVYSDDKLATNSDFEWSSSNNSIISVDNTTENAGKITYHNITNENEPVTISAVKKNETMRSVGSVQITITAPKLTLTDSGEEIKEPTKHRVEDTVTTDASSTIAQTRTFTAAIDGDATTYASNVKWETESTNVFTVDNGVVSYKGPGTADLYIYMEFDEYKSDTISIPIILTPYVYSFTKQDEEETDKITYKFTEGEELKTINAYRSSQMTSTPTQFTIQRTAGKTTESSLDLTKFVYTVYQIDSNTRIATEPAEGETAPISISAAGEVTINKLGDALIKAQPKDKVASEFYIGYTVTEAKFTIGGQWKEDDDTPYLSDTDKKMVVLGEDGEAISTTDYTISWSLTDEFAEQPADNGIEIDATTGALKFNKHKEEHSEACVTITATVENKTTHQKTTVSTDKLTYPRKDVLTSSLQVDTIEGTVGESKNHTLLVNGKAAPAGTFAHSIDQEEGTTIATVGETTGHIEFKAVGNARLITTYKPHANATEEVQTWDILVSQGNTYLNYTWVVGDPYTDSVVLKMFDALGQQMEDLRFTSKDTSVCTVECSDGKNGQLKLLKAKPEGTTVTVESGSTVITCQVYVREAPIELSHKSIKATTTDEGKTLNAYVYGRLADSAKLVWEVEDGNTSVSFDTENPGKLIYNSPTGDTPAAVHAKYYWQGKGFSVSSTSEKCLVSLTAPTFSTDVPTSVTEFVGESRTVGFYVNGVKQTISEGKILGSALTLDVSEASMADLVEFEKVGDNYTGKITFKAKGTVTIIATWALGAKAGAKSSLTTSFTIKIA